jgi:hypothetical protein
MLLVPQLAGILILKELEMRAKWREPKNSPDWTDIFTTMRAIEQLHSVTVFITMTAGVYDGPSGFTTLAARKEEKLGEASVLGAPVIVSSGEWPCRTHKDFAACLYAALLEMDAQLSSKLWKQMQMPFTAE